VASTRAQPLAADAALTASDKGYVSRAVEVSIHVGMLVLTAAACFIILRPFLPLLTWGVIVAIAVYPRYHKLERSLGGRQVLAAVIVTALLLALLIVPAVLLTGTLMDGVETLATNLKSGQKIIPPPPEALASWPIVGAPLSEAWSLASSNVSAAITTFTPQIKAVLPAVLAASAGIGLTVLQFALAIVVAGILLAKALGAAGIAHSLATRIFGENGSEFEQVATATIRSVTTGILGVALIQTVLAAIGFLLARMPGAGLWAIIFLFSAVLQVGTLVLIPAVIYMFATASITKAAIFAGWCLLVALIDNVLKPVLLGRGVAVPIAVVFLGAIGGFMAMGILGLFVGAIVLSVGYKLLLTWLNLARVPAPASSKP
jgi:predicted PurR-regulated permease PerM